MPAPLSSYFQFNTHYIMKLHLPTRLRAALMACFAVVTSLTTTLATGAFVGGAFAVAIADATEAVYSGETNNNIDLSVVPDDKTLTFNMSPGGEGNYFSNDDHEYSGDIIISGGESAGLCINNGYAHKRIEFSGSVSGDGLISKTKKGTDITLAFTGDATDYQGKINLSSASGGPYFKLQFERNNYSTSTQGVSGTGDISFTTGYNELVYDYSGESVVYVTNRILVDDENGSSKVILKGTSAVEFTKDVTIHELFGAATYSPNDNNNYVEATGSANASRITFKGANSTLGKSGKTNTITSTLEVAQGAGLTLAGTMSFASLGDTARVRGNGTVSIASGFILDLGAEFTPELNKEYKLFADSLTVKGWDTLASSAIVREGLDLGRTQFVTTNTGVLYTTGYSDMSTSGTQNWDYTSTVWTTAQDDTEDAIAFAAGDSAVLSADAALTVQSAGINANKVTISGADTEVALSGGALTVANGVIIGNGAKLTLNTKTNATGAICGKVTVENGGTLQFNANDVTGYNGGATSLRTLRVNAGGSVVLNLSGGSNNNETFAGKLYLDGTLSTTGTGIWDMFGDNSEIIVGDNNANASISTAIRLRRTDAPITVGKDSTLTVSGTLSKGDAGNGILKKQGAGVLKFTSAIGSEVAGLALNGGSVQLLGGGSMGAATVNATETGILLGGGSSLSSVTSAVDAFTLAGNGTTGTVTTLNANGGMTTLSGTGLSITNLNAAATGGLTVDTAAECSVTNLALAQSMTNKGALTLGSKLDLSALTLGDSAAVSGTGSAVITAGMLVELGSDFTPELNKEYKVFGDDQTLTGWTDLTTSSFRKGGAMLGRSEVELTEKGFKFTSVGAVYTDMTTAGTQNWNYTDAVWDTAQDSSDEKIAFASGDSAVFSANADMTITESTISALAVTVNEGVTLTLTGNGNKLDSAGIVLNGDLVLKDSALAATSRVSGAGDLYIGGEVTIGDTTNYQVLTNHTGNIIVNSGGVLKPGQAGSGNDGSFGKHYGQAGSPIITVKAGGAVDISGIVDVYYHVILEEGAFYKNTSSTNITDHNKQLPKLELQGNATVHAVGMLGMMGGSGTATELILNGNTLSKTGNGEFFLNNTRAGNGTLDVQAGRLTVKGNNGSYTDTQFNVSGTGTNLTISGGTHTGTGITVGSGSTLTITSGTHNGAAISAENGSALTISGGTFSNASIAVRSGSGIIVGATNATLGATVTVGNGSTFQAYGGTYTDTAIVLEDGATFNYRTGANHTFKSFNTGTSTLSSAGNSNYTMTVVEDSVSTGLLTKSNIGHLAYDGKADLQGGLNITGGSVRFNSNASIAGPVTMSNGTALHVGGEADVKISGTGHDIKGLNVLADAGVTFESGSSATLTNTTLAAPITNKGALTLSGTLTVNSLDGFTPEMSETSTYKDAAGNIASSGYLQSENLVYTLIENTGTLNDDAILSVNGVAGSYADGKLTVAGADTSTFYVNAPGGTPDEITAVDLGANKKYSMNGGTLIIDSSVSDAADDILLSTVGDAGTIRLATDVLLTDNAATISGAKLEIASGAKLSLGSDQVGTNVNGADIVSKTASISSFASTTINGGTLFVRGVEGNLGTIISKEGSTGSVLQLYGMTGAANVQETSQRIAMDALQLNADLTLTCNFRNNIDIANLSGSGNLVAQHYFRDSNDNRDTCYGVVNLNIDSLKGYTGAISMIAGNGKDAAANVNISTGTMAVAMDGISVTDTTLNLTVDAATTMTNGITLTGSSYVSPGSTANVTIAAGGSLTADLTVEGNGNVFNLTGGNLQGNVVLNNGAALTLNVAAEQSVTVAGVSESGETSALTKGGAGELNMGTSATLDTLSVTAGTVRLQSGTIGNMMITGGVTHITGATSTVGSEGTFSSSHNNGLYIKGASEVNIGDGTTTSVVTATRVEMGDADSGSGGTLNVKSGSRLIVESPDVINHGAASQDTYHKTGFILGEWDVSSTVNVEGVLLLKEASVTCGDNTGYVNVKNGGVLAAKGFLNAENNNGTLVLAMEDGGKLILGDAGITAKTITATLGAGTVGIMADSLISKNVTLESTVGTTFNTAKYVWTSDGANISEGTEGGTLTVSGVLSGSGKLVKTGAGTLKLTATNTYSGGTDLTGGTLEIAAEAALGSGALTITGGVLDVTSNITLGSTVSTTVSGGNLKASNADGWTLSGASVGGATVAADSTGTVTLSGATITGDITGNGKLVLAGTVNATANATVSGASVGGITVTTTDANKLTLNNTTIGSTITNNGALEFSGTQNVTLAGSSATKYADVYGSTTYGDNGYKSTVDVYTLVSGTAASAASDTIWQVNGVALSGKPIFADNVLTHITGDAAGKVYYINRGTVVYETDADCTEAEKLQLNGGKLVMSKELDSTVPTDGITVTGSSTTLELKTKLAANKLSMGTGAATVLMGDGTLNLGEGIALASGISLGTETDAKWTGTVKVSGATLTDANLGALGVTDSTIELDDTDGTLKDGTYAAEVKLTSNSAITLGDGNTFNGGLDATGGTLSIAGAGNSITKLTMANDAKLVLDFAATGVESLGAWSEGPMLTVDTLDTATSGGTLNIEAKVGSSALLTLANGTSKVLATIEECKAALGALTLNGETEDVVQGIGGMEYKYTLEKVGDTGEVNLVITAANVYDGWVATDSDPNSPDDDTTWTDDDAIGKGKWSGVIGAFYGKGSSAVNIDDDGVTTSAVIVSAAANLGTSEYTFTGGMLNTDQLAVNQGSLVLDNAGVNAGQYVVLANDGKLTVNDDTVLTVGEEQTTGGGLVGSFVSVGDEAELINKGTTTIHGTLGVAGTAGVTNSGKLTVDAVSAEEATINNTKSLIITGGGVIGTLSGKGSLTNGGVLSIMSDTTLGALTNTGTLSVAGDLTVTSDITTGGTISVDGDAELKSAVADSLTVGGNAKAAGLTVGTADITGTLEATSLTVGTRATVGSDATLGALTNKGTLEVGGKLTVTSDITTGGTVKVTGNADLAGADFGSLTVGGNATAAGLTVGTANITGTLEADSLTVGTRAKVGSDATLGALTNKGTLEVGGKLTVTSDITTGGTVKADSAELAGADFDSLTVRGHTTAVALTVKNADLGSLNETSLTVTSDITTGGMVKVGADTTLAALSSTGTLAINGDLAVKAPVAAGGAVKADNVTVAGDAVFTTLTTGKLTADSLAVANATLTTLAADKLTVNGGTVKVGSDTTLTALSSTGMLEIAGDLAVNASVAAGGAVKADNVTVAGDAVFTTLTTGQLTADSLAVANATLTTLATDKLTVNGGTVKVTDDVSLSRLAGTGQLTVDDKLTLTAAATGTVGVQAAEVVLHQVGSTLGSVATDDITMAEGSTLSRTTALLTVDSIAALTADKVDITVSDSAFDALELSSDGSYSVGDYLIIAGATKADVFNYVNAEQLDAIRYTGKTAGLVVTDGVLSLSIAQATDESGKVIGNTWDTTGGNTTTSNGYDIPVGEDGFYKSLDYVSNVVVSDEYTIDLTPDMVGDSMPGNASEPDAGLLVRNLAGGGTLTIKGDGAEQDVVSLFGTAHSAGGDAVKVVVDAAALNLGLPVGNDGVMAEDAAATGATLARLSLKNLARAEVNADSLVTGATDLEDYTKLMVADGMTLETGQLLGGDNAEVGGRIIVLKSGYYTGQYDEAYIGTGDGADLTLRVGGRRGLSLTAGGGSVKLLSAGQDGRMESLRVGPNPMARQAGGSTNLVLDNTTLRSDGSVEHHMTTIAAEEGNFINKSIVSLSLGAAETARTLNTAGNPVVLDGVVDVTDSAVKVNMIGAAVTEGVLDVTTDADKNLTLARLTMAGGAISGNTVTLTGTTEMMALVNKYYTNARLDANGAIKVDRVTDYYGRAMGELSENGMAGVQLADAALVKLNPQSDRDDYKELAEVLDTLDAVVKGGDTEAADQLGSALAGSSVAAMGAALAGDMERQLRAIRNRTTTMGVDQTAVNKDMPYFNAWINAEGDLRRLDQDTTYAGYDLSSWGGTVGFDVDVTPQLTFGLAVTSMWGDFTAKGCELAEGELQTNYVTAFARYGARRWVHTFVASVGMSETSLERTVNHANGSYTTEGDADGVSYGFLYEVGYVFAANEEATACIQPVVNVMLAHSSLSGYDESGSSAALSTGDVDMTTLTIGAGVRAQAVMGENLYNRASIVEARALFKVRGGDREATAENALLAVPGSAVSAKAAEMGTLSCELGIGVTVPIGADGSSVFADASVDVGGGYSDFNGTVGYRINF